MTQEITDKSNVLDEILTFIIRYNIYIFRY